MDVAAFVGAALLALWRVRRRPRSLKGSTTAKYDALVGVVGGLGPKATAAFLDAFVERRVALLRCGNLNEFRLASTAEWTSEEVEFVLTSQQSIPGDEEHPPIVVFNQTTCPRRPEYVLAKVDGSEESLEDPTESLIQTAQRLAKAGCTHLCVPCHTAHFFIKDVMLAANEVEWIDLIKVTLEFCKRKGHETVGLLATEATIKGEIYSKYALEMDMKVRHPNLQDGSQRNVLEAIAGEFGIKSGFVDVQGKCEFALKNLSLLTNEAKKMSDCTAIVLACTELPLVMSSKTCPNLEIVDASTILVDHVLKLALLSRR